MIHATRFGYWVIQWTEEWDPNLTDLLRLAPELVLGRRVAITSCDSGPYVPSEHELDAGWRVVETTAISKEVAQLEELPTPGFDEWYVFDSPPQVVPLRNHVNQYNFSVLDESDASELFWEQIRNTQPFHVLGAGTPNMFLVTRDCAIFNHVKQLSTSP